MRINAFYINCCMKVDPGYEFRVNVERDESL